jgi:hypothetical protein
MSIFLSIENLLTQITGVKSKKIGIIATKEFLEKNRKQIIPLNIKIFEL